MRIECTVLVIYFITSAFGQTSEFSCSNGRVIPVEQFCNGVEDCDGSDELPVNNTSNSFEINCLHAKTNRSCRIHRDYICNGTIQCINSTFCDVGCSSHYKCRDNSCVPRSTICDGNGCNGCKEDDEWKTGIGFKCIKNGVTCRLPQQLLWDNVQDCDDGSDLCYKFNLTHSDGKDLRTNPGTLFDRQSCFMCLDGSMVVPRSKLCDRIIDCSDLSDECLCPNDVPDICDMVLFPTSTTSITCSNSSVCSTNVTASCQAGQVVCGDDKVCVNRSSVCDGTADCRSHVDEGESYCRGTLPCASALPHEATRQCRCSNLECVKTTGILCDGYANCPVPGSTIGTGTFAWAEPPGYPADECDARCPRKPGFNCTIRLSYGFGTPIGSISCGTFAKGITCFQHYTSNGTRVVVEDFLDTTKECDGILDCPADYADEKNCPKRFTCKSGNKVNIPIENVCDGRVDCDLGWDENETMCPQRFFCSSLQGVKVSVSKEVICDFNINCDKGEDEKNCSTAKRFYCENGNPLFVSKNKVFDGRGDCTDWSDECPTTGATKDENVLASRYELIGNPFLRALVWIMGLLSIAGNLTVIVGECKKLKSMLRKHDVATIRTNHMLVLNLAVSDFLMGVYLIMLGIAGAVYSGFYCSKSLEWLTSKTCVAMGVLVVLSSETSMITMVLLTLSRLYAVTYPFVARRKPRAKFIILPIMLTWIISATIALFPLFASYQNIFVEKAWIQDNPFIGDVVHFHDAKKYTERMFTYSPELSRHSDIDIQEVMNYKYWYELEKFFGVYVPRTGNFNIYRYFGYYSANSVCIPNFFVTRESWSWKFSLSVTIINFFGFMLVAAAYMIVIWKLARSKEVSDLHGLPKKTEAQRKIMRLIITDFCCWIPLSIMVFVHFSGVRIGSVAYAVAAIVLLPINSALNPILYSNFIDNIWLKLKSTNKPKHKSSDSKNTTQSSL